MSYHKMLLQLYGSTLVMDPYTLSVDALESEEGNGERACPLALCAPLCRPRATFCCR